MGDTMTESEDFIEDLTPEDVQALKNLVTSRIKGQPLPPKKEIEKCPSCREFIGPIIIFSDIDVYSHTDPGCKCLRDLVGNLL